MNNQTSQATFAFLQIWNESLSAQTFIKMTLADYHGQEEALKKCIIKSVMIKGAYKLSFTYRYKTRDITKNYSIQEASALISAWMDDCIYRAVTMRTVTQMVQLQHHGKSWKMKKETADEMEAPSLQHDHQKKRLINDLSQSYLYHLGLTNQSGKILKESQDKYKQINNYIELLAPALSRLKDNTIHIADMGSGKGYLTFALYDYLKNTLNLNACVTGVEYRQDMVDLCNTIAASSSFDQLAFVQGTIENYLPNVPIDILIALHACDTATDDAIYKGIANGAQLIVTAPCCHKEVRAEMTKSKVAHELQFITQYGIFLERQAEMITDSIRAMLLEYAGYQVKVIQFVSDAHTPKNVMILAERKEKPESPENVLEKREELLSIFEKYGIRQQRLAKLLKII